MTEDAVVKEFEAAGAILKGHFVLSSGFHSDTYLQCARALMDAERASRLCAELAKKLKDAKLDTPDVVVGPAMGGVIVSYELARHLKKPAMFCERVAGDFALRRGFDIEEGQKVLLVEDVVTTGKSSLEAKECIEEAGGIIIGEACLIDRSGGEHDLPFPLVSLMELKIPLYADDEVPAELKAVPAVKPGSRWTATKKSA